jgi:hypothetical protein
MTDYDEQKLLVEALLALSSSYKMQYEKEMADNCVAHYERAAYLDYLLEHHKDSFMTDVMKGKTNLEKKEVDDLYENVCECYGGYDET